MTELRWTTAGESHGHSLVGILEGLPYGLALDVALIDEELTRRQAGFGRGGRMQIERDRVHVLGGLRAGMTLGSPLALAIENKDATLEKLPDPSSPRPGHADLAGCQQLGVRDARAVLERASSRETAMRVALGAAARQLLHEFGIEVFGYVRELGGLAARNDAFEAAGSERRALRSASAFQGLDAQQEASWRAAVEDARNAGDTLGGIFEVRATGVPPGLGSYVDPAQRLTARLGSALFSIPAMKGVEIGLGFEAARLRGSKVHDEIVNREAGDTRPFGRFARSSNRAGGLEGGLTNGEDLIVRVAMKPIPTLRRSLASMDFESGAATPATYQRSDVTSVPSASVVGEAMVALELARALRSKLGGDSLAQMHSAFEHYLRGLAQL